MTCNQKRVEDETGCTLPPDLTRLWNRTAGLVLFQDITYGQWGLVLWTPDQVLIRHKEKLALHSEEFRPGDLIIGEFLGDTDLLVIRADPNATDFGSILIALPIDKRPDWYNPARSLNDFLEKFLESKGEKFWEPQYN
ncbi:MAG: SMI1/KNR4 family protein [Chloroflexi bacterium]|nr:SMI1/KNR4 family protein [Chloroflexota bacterium]